MVKKFLSNVAILSWLLAWSEYWLATLSINFINHFYWTRVRSLAMLVSNSLTDWLTNSCLVNLIDVTLACEDVNSKLVEVVTVADVDAEDHVGNSLLQIWELTFGPKTKLFSDFEHKGWSRFWSWSSARFWNWSLFSILPLMFCRGYKVESWSIFWS